ncbi:hypothetical protein D3C76_1583400 [compost metagenome]
MLPEAASSLPSPDEEVDPEDAPEQAVANNNRDMQNRVTHFLVINMNEFSPLLLWNRLQNYCNGVLPLRT